MHVLFVCTAGRCRSPMAAALLEKHLGPVTSRISVSSGGLMVAGKPMPPIGVSLLAERQIDLSSHVSAQLTEHSLAGADIVLGMTREHVREVVAISPDAWPKTFTLKDFVRRAEGHTRGRHQRVADWLDGVGAERGRYDVLGADPDDDVLDPFGQRSRVWNRVIREVDELVTRIVPTLGVSRPESHGDHEERPLSEDASASSQDPRSGPRRRHRLRLWAAQPL